MNREILTELEFFGTCLLWGVYLLVFYDVFRIIRRVFPRGAILVGIEDLLYWTVSSILIFRMMYQQNNGIIRGFAILGIFLGMLLYRNFLSDPLVDLIAGFLNKIKDTIFKVIGLLLKPFVLLGRLIAKGFRKVFKLFKIIFANLQKLLKKNKESSKISLSDKEKGG
ncbi:spore cortex biosynthesis protein YabQ [Anaerocolumna sp. AGMB13020]|uniref:spore cortex biosynthesis protein YabQ n=1 Tax=Anaerocolumna sp. AGMB13020 TaxID=3081750 RepID=UPI0029545141|nr:spore cortex biosynthesis protein YabQ [Anaerocolumna sp. AGMB13020]WOO34776.1 spore cortex biosynthesis protein YabQ [Anaerocolumna sp. AGMB13020]